MSSQNLAEIVNRLTPEQQSAVRAFIDYLEARSSDSPFQSAVREFVDAHPELLKRLAQ